MKTLYIMLGLTLPAAALAEPAFNPDRPGFADSPGGVPAGHVMAEMGAAVAFPTDGASIIAPNALVRVGVLDWLEARLLLPSYNRADPYVGKVQQGLGDMGVGTKFTFDAGPFDLGVVATLLIPTGEDDFTSDSWGGVLGVNHGIAITDHISFGGVLGLDLVENEGGERVVGTFASGAFSALHGPVTVYAEAFTTRPDGGPFAVGGNVGTAYAVSARGQIDATMTFRINEEGPDPGVSFGTSWLW